MNFYEYVAQDAECKTPIDKCRAKGGPAECRWHRCFSPCGIEAVDGLNIDKLSKDRIRFVFKKADKDSEEKIKGVANEVLSGILESYSGFEAPRFHLICADTTVPFMPAMSELDTQRTPEAFICIGKADFSNPGGYSYCHSGDRGYEDVFRHELAHVMTTAELGRKFSLFEDKIIERIGEKQYFDMISDCISDYAAESFRHERLAEIFSVVTDSKRGEGEKEVPEQLKEFVVMNMLSGGKKRTSDESGAMDSSVVQGEDEYVPKCSFFPLGSKPNGCMFDSEAGEWIKESEYNKRFGTVCRNRYKAK